MSVNTIFIEKVRTRNKYNPLEPVNLPVGSPLDDNIRPMYKVHKYWARKPWYVVNEYIKHFTKKGDTVLDPFCGSGVTGVEAIASNRKAILVDLNPIAVFIAKNTARVDINLNDLNVAFENIRKECEAEISNLYRLDEKCPICNSDLEMRHLLRGPKFSKWTVYGICPRCDGKKQGIRRFLKKSELNWLKNIESQKIKHWYPKDAFPEKFDKDRVTYKGIKHIYQIFTKRNLYALSILWHSIAKIKDDSMKDLLKLSFLNTLLHVSKLKAENVRPMAVNNYWVPDDWIEENVWFRFCERFGLLKKGKEISLKRITKESHENLNVYNASALYLSMIENNSIDYIFTDPPYGDSIQYFELSMIWNAWLGRMPSNKEEAVINSAQKKNIEDYGSILEAAFKEMFRVLRYGKWISVCFHNKEFKIWNTILRACRNAGFILINAVPQEPISQSFNQSWAKYATKTDIIINLVKPYPEDISYLYEKYGRNGKVKVNDIIDEMISSKNISSVEITDLYNKIIIKVMRESFFSTNAMDQDTFSIYKIDKLLSKHAIGKEK